MRSQSLLGTRRTWLYWLAEPIDFTGSERIELKTAGAGGKHGIAYVVFMPRPPEPRALPLEVKHMTTQLDPEQSGRVTFSWTTSWPCPTRLQWGVEGARARVVEEGPPCLAHRVVLEGLDPTKRHFARAVGEGPDGDR